MAFPPRIQSFSDVGKAFYINRSITIPVSSIAYIALKTNGTIVSIESIVATGISGDTNISYSVGSTFTESNPIVTHRFNRLVIPEEDGSNLTAFNPTAVSSEGTNIFDFKTFADAGTGNQTDTSSISGLKNFELILKENEVFLIKIDNVDSLNIADINVGIIWIEEKE